MGIKIIEPNFDSNPSIIRKLFLMIYKLVVFLNIKLIDYFTVLQRMFTLFYHNKCIELNLFSYLKRLLGF